MRSLGWSQFNAPVLISNQNTSLLVLEVVGHKSDEKMIVIITDPISWGSSQSFPGVLWAGSY